jgi:hypothetical protein
MAITIADDYYNTLAMFEGENRYFPTVRQIPLTITKDVDGDGILEEVPFPFIIVNLDSRGIELPEEYKDFLSMESDHRAENLFFLVDRYYEDIDLFHTTCVVEYINANNEARMYPITLYDTESLKKEGKMIMAWCIGHEATAAAGTIQFALHFYTLNLKTKSYNYSLRTKPAKGNILYGMDLSREQQQETDEYYGAINYNALVAMINQKNVYWNDL